MISLISLISVLLQLAGPSDARSLVKRQSVNMDNPSFFDMTRITQTLDEPEPTVVELDPSVAFYQGIGTQVPVGMGAFFETYEGPKLTNARGWDFRQTFNNDPLQFGFGLPLYPRRLDSRGKARVIHPDQFIKVGRRKKRQIAIIQPEPSMDGQRIYMVREQPGFRFKNNLYQQSSGDMMLQHFRFDKESQTMKSWRLGGDLTGGRNTKFDTGIDWPANFIDLSDSATDPNAPGNIINLRNPGPQLPDTGLLPNISPFGTLPTLAT